MGTELQFGQMRSYVYPTVCMLKNGWDGRFHVYFTTVKKKKKKKENIKIKEESGTKLHMQSLHSPSLTRHTPPNLRGEKRGASLGQR